MAWLGGTWSCSGKIHKPQMFREEKPRYKSTSRDTEVTVDSKSNTCKKTLNSIHTHAFFHGKMSEKTFCRCRTEPCGPTPAQQLSKVYFKGICSLSKASRISRVLRVKHRLKIASLPGTGCLPCRPSLLSSQLLGVYTGCWDTWWDDRIQSKATISGEDQSDQRSKAKP